MVRFVLSVFLPQFFAKDAVPLPLDTATEGGRIRIPGLGPPAPATPVPSTCTPTVLLFLSQRPLLPSHPDLAPTQTLAAPPEPRRASRSKPHPEPRPHLLWLEKTPPALRDSAQAQPPW